jgi:hypothetical protein
VRIALGALTLAAIGVQFETAAKTPHFDPVNFFGYFTILSNIFAALVLIYVAIDWREPSRSLDVVRGAATFCMALVGIVFSLLLANLESNLIGWVNVVVHYLMPLALIADWLVVPPRHRLSGGDAATWLALPFAYLVYTLVRGAILHWYPYPFLDVDQAGGDNVAWAIVALLLGATALAAVLRWAGSAHPLYRSKV